MIEKAKFKYSAQEGILELEGTEEFVSKHFESLTDIVRLISRHTVIEQKKESHSSPDETLVSSGTPDINQSQQESLANYPHFFSEINGKLKIVTEIPGNNKRAQMTNAAILYCFGSSLMGEDQVGSKDIRTVCEEHGCLDSANFSKIFEEKSIFLSDGIRGGNKEIKLTFQGQKKAKELLNNGQSKG